MSTDSKIKHDDLFHIRLSLIKARTVVNQLCVEREARGLVEEANSYVHEVRDHLKASEDILGEITHQLNLSDNLEFTRRVDATLGLDI